MIKKPEMSPDDPRCYHSADQLLSEIAQANGMSAEAASALASIDEVMGRIRRSIMKRDFGRRILQQLSVDLEVVHMDVIGAVGHEHPETAEEVTVGLVAERLAIDPSRASRLVADVVDRGYIRRVASQADSRRICLELTEAGRTLVQAIRQTKWTVFSAALGKWSEDELVTFARLLDRFSTWTSEFRPAADAAAPAEARKPQPVG
jgi:DNA-binding MarR family transcriptional regulator